MKYGFLFFLCFFFSGCQSLTEEKIKCPKVAIVAELLKTVEIHNGVPIRIELDSLRSSCVREGTSIIMDLQVRITALRPFRKINTTVTVTPSYFVAVVDRKGNLLSRTTHEAELVFNEKQGIAVSFQRLQERVPSLDATVYIGFNLEDAHVTSLQKEREKAVFSRNGDRRRRVTSH